MRGSFSEAFALHPALPVLALEAALAWLAWGWSLATGRRLPARWAPRILLATAAALVVLWFVRLGLGTLPP